MRSRIVRLTVAAAAAALVMFGVPLAVGLAQFAAADERSSLQRLAEFVALTVQDDVTHDRAPTALPPGPGDASISLYDDRGARILGDGPPTADEPVDRVLRRGLSAGPPGPLVVAAPISDTHQVVGVVRVARPTTALAADLLPVWLGMAALAALILMAVWLLARQLARRLSRPLERIASDAARLGDGDFAVRPRVTGIPEVDLVGTAIGGTGRRLDDLLARERSFSAEASHQLRTPLAGLRLRLESTLDRPDRLTRATVKDGLASIDRLERTIDDLLELAREGGTRKPIDLARLMHEAGQEWTGRLAEGGRAFVVGCPEDLPDPAADAAAVRQILAVLLDNAATHGAGTVSLSAREAGATAVALDVSDEGPGPSDAALAGDRGRMGIALARRLAEAQGGRLTIRRSPSTATLLLPVAPSSPCGPD